MILDPSYNPVLEYAVDSGPVLFKNSPILEAESFKDNTALDLFVDEAESDAVVRLATGSEGAVSSLPMLTFTVADAMTSSDVELGSCVAVAKTDVLVFDAPEIISSARTGENELTDCRSDAGLGVSVDVSKSLEIDSRDGIFAMLDDAVADGAGPSTLEDDCTKKSEDVGVGVRAT